MTACQICKFSSPQSEVWDAREQMFGLPGTFRYLECGACGCVQLLNVPQHMEKYYPVTYYSHAPVQSTHPTTVRKLKNRLATKRDAAHLFRRNWLGAVLAALKPNPGMDWLRRVLAEMGGGSRDIRILDVGCGRGQLLIYLAGLGFRNLVGIDAYMSADVAVERKVSLKRCTLDQLDEYEFDFINLSHTLEHLPDQFAILKQIQGRLSANGVCRIEVPVASSEAWRRYRTDWFELDAPRHLFLHTSMSFKVVAESAKLEIVSEKNVGTPMEFWGSEMYRRGLTCYDPVVQKNRDPTALFTEDEMRGFEAASTAANDTGRGGRIEYLLRP